MFNDLNKTIKEGQERWKTIEDLAEELEVSMTTGGVQPIMMAHLLLKIVEHLRPMNPSQEQLDEATSGLADLLKTLKK
jgi:siroheme synthase (precorrin-2 oxidase/ferrochelatase)